MELSLLKKAKKGDKKALKKLMINNSEYIYKLAFMHTKYEDDAKIIMKNTIAYINDNIYKLSKIKNFNEYVEEVGVVEDDNNINYLDINGNIDMYKAIDLLDIYQKNVIILLYFYKMTYKEVGDILDMNESTIKMYLRSALKNMKESII